MRYWRAIIYLEIGEDYVHISLGAASHWGQSNSLCLRMCSEVARDKVPLLRVC